jgi:hypothetical protein
MVGDKYFFVELAKIIRSGLVLRLIVLVIAKFIHVNFPLQDVSKVIDIVLPRKGSPRVELNDKCGFRNLFERDLSIDLLDSMQQMIPGEFTLTRFNNLIVLLLLRVKLVPHLI